MKLVPIALFSLDGRRLVRFKQGSCVLQSVPLHHDVDIVHLDVDAVYEEGRRSVDLVGDAGLFELRDNCYDDFPL